MVPHSPSASEQRRAERGAPGAGGSIAIMPRTLILILLLPLARWAVGSTLSSRAASSAAFLATSLASLASFAPSASESAGSATEVRDQQCTESHGTCSRGGEGGGAEVGEEPVSMSGDEMSDLRSMIEALVGDIEDGRGPDAAVEAKSGTDGNSVEASSEREDHAPKTGPNGDRLITHAELALHTGEGGASPANPIWISILGRVYDVTTGEDYYGEKSGGYRFYAGRDASPCFSSGNNTPEGAGEKLEEWEDSKLMAVWEWSDFYADHETYEYLGVLAGSRYYDEGGNELPLRNEIITRAKEAKQVAERERERKKRERIAAREARKKRNK